MFPSVFDLTNQFAKNINNDTMEGIFETSAQIECFT